MGRGQKNTNSKEPYFFINHISSSTLSALWLGFPVPRWGSLYHEWPVVPFSIASNVWTRRSSRFRCTILTRIHTTRSKGCSIFHVTVRNTTFVSCHVRRTKEYQLKKNPSTLSAPWFCLQRHWFSLYSHHRWSSCCSASYSPRPSPCYLCVFGWEGYNSTSKKQNLVRHKPLTLCRPQAPYKTPTTRKRREKIILLSNPGNLR